jgi:hypothetical protein
VALSVVAVGAVAWADAGDSTAGSYNNYLRLGYQFGYILKSNDFVRGQNLAGEPIDWYHAGRLELGWQTAGSEPWQQVWNYPAFALGFYAVEYQNEDELGNPMAVYGTATWPLLRWARSSFSVEAGFGLSFNWKPFDPATNPYNSAIGNFQSAYIDIGFEYSHQVSRRLSLTGAFTGTHFSNGGTRQPNWGINQIGLQAWATYTFVDQIRTFPTHEVPTYEPNWEVLLQLSGGPRQVAFTPADTALADKYVRVNFAVATLSAAVNRQITYKSKLGGGLDLVYDSGTKAQLDAGDGQVDDLEDLPLGDQVRVGIFGGYEFVLHRYSVLLQLGYSVIQKGFEGQLPRLYQRLGAKYYFLNDVYGGVNVRFQDFGKATHLEYNIGYAFNL